MKKKKQMGQKLSLPQNDPDPAGRAALLEKARQSYQFDLDPPQLPKHYKGVPTGDEVDGQVLQYTVWTGLDMTTAMATFKFNQIVNFKQGDDPLRDYERIFPEIDGSCGCCTPPLTCPKVAKTWRTDKEFGYQRLNGFDCVSIKLFTKYVTKFPVEREERVQRELSSGRTIESEMVRRRLFWIDLEVLDGIVAPSYTTLCAPIGLFWLNDDDDLVPIAIQLNQQAGPTNPIFTPSDHPGLWLFVKLHFQHANSVYHENVLHAYSSHLWEEVFYVGGRRTISERHPVMELLRYHFWMTVVINSEARVSTVAANGAVSIFLAGANLIPSLIAKVNAKFDFNELDVEKDIAARGVSDIPKYYYRDDALRVFRVIKKYMQGLVWSIYSDEGALLRDPEIRAWLPECMASLGWQNVPPAIHSRDTLVDVLAVIINTCSARHAAMNNPHFDMRGFIPNNPAVLTRPVPTSREADLSDQEIANALPTYDQAVVQAGFFHSISIPSPPDRMLGKYSSSFMRGFPQAKFCIEMFQQDLLSLSAAIKERNKLLPQPYPYQDPELIPCSTAA